MSPNPNLGKEYGFKAVFRCINACAGEYALSDVIYRCPNCRDLLEVVHDLERLRRIPSDTWKAVLDARFACGSGPMASGVWDKREWVCPEIADENIVSAGEGRTPLFRADRFAEHWGLRHLWIKQCGTSHTGSFKDLGMTVLVSMVRQMQRQGRDIPAVACASTGDTSAALAAYCAAAGIAAIVFLPKNRISSAQLMQPLAHGAITVAIDSDFDGCMKIVEEITSRHNIYLANSMNSLRVEGQKTVAVEICRQLGWEPPDLVVIPGGNLGNVSALGQGFSLMLSLGMISRLPRIVCAQAQNANPLYLSYLRGFDSFEPVEARPTVASAIQIGNPVSFRKAIRVLRLCDGAVEQASEEELADAAAEADRCGLYCCPHTAVALAALKKLVRRGQASADARTVVISTAHGLKFTPFKAACHEPLPDGRKRPFANRPIEVDAVYDKVRDVVLRALELRRNQFPQ